jgi:hypothetical protein
LGLGLGLSVLGNVKRRARVRRADVSTNSPMREAMIQRGCTLLDPLGGGAGGGLVWAVPSMGEGRGGWSMG